MRPDVRRLVLLTGLAILIAAFVPVVVSAAGHRHARLGTANAAYSEDQYWELVNSSAEAVANVKGSSPDAIRRTLDGLSAKWQEVSAVTVAGNQTVPIDNSYLLSVLKAPNADIDRIETILSSLESAHKSYPSDAFTTADLKPLQQILARPEFQGLDQPRNPLAEWLQSVWNRLARWFKDLLNRIFGNRGITINLDGWSPLGILSLVLFALILVYAARSIFADFISEAMLKENGNDADQDLTSATAFEKSQALSRAGDYRSAVRYLYLSSLLLLDERGLLRYDHSKTNGEVLRSVSDSPELADPLHDVIDVFDRVWYGFHMLDEDSFKHYSKRVEELKERKK